MKNMPMLLVPAVVGGAGAALPFAPSGKMWLCAAEVALLAILMLGLGVYDWVRKVPSRPAIPLVWLCFACGFGCLAWSLALMAQTWGVKNSHRPWTQIDVLFMGAMVFVVAGSIGLISASQQRTRQNAR